MLHEALSFIATFLFLFTHKPSFTSSSLSHSHSHSQIPFPALKAKSQRARTHTSENMSAVLDMALDDLIKSNKQRSGNSRSRTRPSRSGPARRLPNRAANRSAPYATAAKAPEMLTWQQDPYAAQGGRAPSIETGTKLYISNLDYGVSNDDIKELFSEVGDLKHYGVHYDRSGRSKGMAEVVFSRRADAVAAVKRYNNVQLDGKPMKIDIAGTNISTPGVAPAANGAIGNSNGFLRSSTQGRGGAFGRPGGRGQGIRRGRGRGRGRGGGHREKLSAKDLDADLEKYHADAVELN